MLVKTRTMATARARRPGFLRCWSRVFLSGIFALICSGSGVAFAAPVTSGSEGQIAAHVSEAATRFAIHEHWIRAVMQAESAGRPRAISRAGAMGLMQIMPATWAELRRQYRLGNDPFDPRANILAGAAYLRAMFDRYGKPRHMLAAYNAGPGRVDQYLSEQRRLPAETRAYVASLGPAIADVDLPSTSVPPPDWRQSGLFVGSRTGADEAFVMAGAEPSPDPSTSLFPASEHKMVAP